jgi:hypothetical protein
VSIAAYDRTFEPKTDWTTIVGEGYSAHYIDAPFADRKNVCAAFVAAELSRGQVRVVCQKSYARTL